MKTGPRKGDRNALVFFSFRPFHRIKTYLLSRENKQGTLLGFLDKSLPEGGNTNLLDIDQFCNLRSVNTNFGYVYMTHTVE